MGHVRNIQKNRVVAIRVTSQRRNHLTFLARFCSARAATVAAFASQLEPFASLNAFSPGQPLSECPVYNLLQKMKTALYSTTRDSTVFRPSASETPHRQVSSRQRMKHSRHRLASRRRPAIAYALLNLKCTAAHASRITHQRNGAQSRHIAVNRAEKFLSHLPFHMANHLAFPLSFARWAAP